MVENKCPLDLKPVLYRRCVDDTFLLFPDYLHTKLLFDFLNKQHRRIQFTYEVEKQNSLLFFDVFIEKVGDHSETSSLGVHPTGLGVHC